MFISFALIRSDWEQKHFIVRSYKLKAEGLKGSFKAAVIADLHGAVYGEGNERLLRAIDEAAPDLILIPGDWITCRRGADHPEAPDLSLLRALASRYPVYYAPGNHEENYLHLHPEYAREVADTGAVFLVNEIAGIRLDDCAGERMYLKPSRERSHGIRGNLSVESLSGTGKAPSRENLAEYESGGTVFIAGLAIGDDYYVRGKQPQMPETFVEEKLGPCPKEGYTILLAHNPGYFTTYARWGCGCILSGHNHGGVIRLPLVGGVISASLHLFDRYDRGIFREGRSTMVLSAGLGMHTIHVRLFNRPELVTVSFYGDNGKNES